VSSKRYGTWSVYKRGEPESSPFSKGGLRPPAHRAYGSVRGFKFALDFRARALDQALISFPTIRAGFNLHHSPTVNREPLNREPV